MRKQASHSGTEDQAGIFETPIPAYDLYGEAKARTSLDPIHLESLFMRSHRHNWTIRPHRHQSLHQVFWIRAGAGVIEAGGRELGFEAPLLLAVPAGEVHGFCFQPHSGGYVLTLTDALLRSCCDMTGDTNYPKRVVAVALCDRPRLRRVLDAAFLGLEQEFRRQEIGRSTAMTGYVLAILSQVQRGIEAEAAARRPRSPQAELVERFRERVEEDFSRQQPLRGYCKVLGATASTLTRACRLITGRSPLALIHERQMLEARRLLSYSSLNISQVAYALGFEPAYFSRFFSKREGISPGAFQQAAATRGGKTDHAREAQPAGDL